MIEFCFETFEFVLNVSEFIFRVLFDVGQFFFGIFEFFSSSEEVETFFLFPGFSGVVEVFSGAVPNVLMFIRECDGLMLKVAIKLTLFFSDFSEENFFVWHALE